MRFFDLHCDTITKFSLSTQSLYNGDGEVTLKKADCFEEYKQCFAVFINDDLRGKDAWEYFLRNVNYYNKELSENESILLNITPFLSIEGGAVIGGDLSRIEKISKLGVKLFTLTWNGENELGYGVLNNLGLKPLGIDAVKSLNSHNITIDVSHLSDKGFYDVAKFSSKPFIASHSNSRVICNNKRNITDEQFAIIKERQGLVGINFHIPFVTKNDDYITSLLKHIYHFLSLGGEDVIAIGSDFDGCETHEKLNSLDKIPWLYAVCVEEFGERISKKIFYNNANQFFKGSEVNEL